MCPFEVMCLIRYFLNVRCPCCACFVLLQLREAAALAHSKRLSEELQRSREMNQDLLARIAQMERDARAAAAAAAAEAAAAAKVSEHCTPFVHAMHRAAGSPCLNMYFASGPKSCFGHATAGSCSKGSVFGSSGQAKGAQSGDCSDPQGLPDCFRGGAACVCRARAGGCTSRCRPHGTYGQCGQHTCATDSQP